MVYRQPPQSLPSLQRFILPAVILSLVLLFWWGFVRPFDPPSPAAMTQPGGGSSLSFIPNGGQNDAAVQYQAHLPGANLFFTDEGLTVGWVEGGMRLNFLGASPSLAINGREAQPGVVNYMLGDGPDSWQTGLPTYGVVTYEGLYPGVSLAFNGQGSQLAAVFQIEPGADPAQIGWAFEWAAPVLDEKGALQLVPDGAAETAVTLSPPQAWQEVDGRDVTVTAAYRLDENGQVGLQMGAFDGELPLAVASNLVVLSSVSSSAAFSVKVDDNGRAYVAGNTWWEDFPLENPYQSTFGGSSDAFVSVFAPDGQSLIYSTFLGGNDDEIINGLALDENNQIYITGHTWSPDFPLANPLYNSQAGNTDAFVTVIAPDGQSLVYSTFLGGVELDVGNDITVDSTGRVYVVGETRSLDFPLANPIQPAYGGGYNDGFITVFAPDGQSLVYSTYLGGDGRDISHGLVVNDSDQAYVAGWSLSSNFPLANPVQPVNNGDYDAVVTVLAPDGQSLIYSTYLGGSSVDGASDIVLDEFGRIYLAGRTGSPDFPVVNPYQFSLDGGLDAFVTILNPSGQAIIYSTYLGGDEADLAESIVLDNDGRMFITGMAESTDFPLVNPFQSNPGNGDIDYDAFISIFASDGQSLDYSTYLGGFYDDWGYGIAVDDDGRFFATGMTWSEDFPLANPLHPIAGNGFDGYLTVFAPDGQSLDYSTYIAGGEPAEPTSVAVSDIGKTAKPNPTLYLLALGLLVLLFVGLWLGNRSRN